MATNAATRGGDGMRRGGGVAPGWQDRAAVMLRGWAVFAEMFAGGVCGVVLCLR